MKKQRRYSVVSDIATGINLLLFVCGFFNAASMVLAFIMLPLSEYISRRKEA